MRHPSRKWLPTAILVAALASAASAQTVFINEFMSSNAATIARCSYRRKARPARLLPSR